MQNKEANPEGVNIEGTNHSGGNTVMSNIVNPATQEPATFSEITTIELTQINPIIYDAGNEIDKEELYDYAKMFKECQQSNQLITDSYWYAILSGNAEAASDFAQMFLKGEIVQKNKSFAKIFESLAIKLGHAPKLNLDEEVTLEEERVSMIIATEIKNFYGRNAYIKNIDIITNVINAQLQSSAKTEEDICYDNKCIKSYFVTPEAATEDVEITGNVFGCIYKCVIL